jgi:hypothetical protein
MTATQAAERLDESVPNCSYHLRQLARYGLAERAEGADARERPWRATASSTTWDDLSDDPAVRAAANELNASILEHYFIRARAHLAERAFEPVDWRAVLGFGDALVHVTAAELADLNGRIEALLAEYDERLHDPSTRPADSRPVGVIQLLVPTGPPPGTEPASPATAPTPDADPDDDADDDADAGPDSATEAGR